MKITNALLFLAAYLKVTSAFAYQLKYFDIRGAAETCRVIFALGEEDYTDVRFKIDPATFQSPEFNEAKENGDLKLNLNRAPVLVTPEGKTIGQSKAIERYLARRFGLMGKTPEEEAMIDCVAEHCSDVKDAARQKGFSKFTRNKTDEEKAEAKKEWFENDMPTMLMKIEEAVKQTSEADGCSFGATTTYADVAIWALIRDCFPADLEDTTKAAEKCVVLNAIADQIQSHPGVAKYLSSRPDSSCGSTPDDSITTSTLASPPFEPTTSIWSTTSNPFKTIPKITFLLSSQDVLTVLIKNCDPFYI